MYYMATDEDVVVRTSGLRMAYGDRTVLDGVDLAVRTGEVVALLGPNGAGKTTTVEIIEGFRRRDAGDVEVLGVDPERGDDAWRARIGVVLQSWRDHRRWKVRELLAHVADTYRPYARAGAPRPRDVDELLVRVGLSDAAGQRTATLSGGQRRRLDVAVGLVGRPDLLVLDEPTAGLDPAARREFHELLHEVVDLDGTVVLMTTHDLAEAGTVADRILLLAGGRIVADGSPAAVAHQVAGPAEVRWTAGGARHVHSTTDPVAFTRDLLATGEVDDLEVVRASLEDAYLEIVRRHDAGEPLSPTGTPDPRTDAARTEAPR